MANVQEISMAELSRIEGGVFFSYPVHVPILPPDGNYPGTYPIS